MHVCDEFRERISDQIIDRQDIQDVELARELLVCTSCADFYAESRELMEAISDVHFEIEEEQWQAMSNRLRGRILEERPASFWSSWLDRLGLSGLRPGVYVPLVAGAMALMLVTVGIYRLSSSVLVNQAVAVAPAPVRPTVSTSPVEVVTAAVPLDPVTVQYLEQSELLLRSVMKLQSTSVDDLKDARETAGRQLVALDQRKEAAAAAPPVVNVMDKYELILRDIRNLGGKDVREDITDIQNRIEKNRLIADMQAFQPKVVTADGDRNDNQ